MYSTKQSELQSYGELEKYLYGGNEAFSFFHRNIRKCMPFVQSPILINKSNGTSNFGYSWSLVVDNNQGDYLSYIWLEVITPEIKLDTKNIYGETGTIRWTENLLHNLIDDVTLTFNDTVVGKINNYALDFITEFSNSESKHSGYLKNIGNIKELTDPSKYLPSKKLFLPLPLFFSKDTGNAIPLTALPHTEIKINFKFREWEELLIFENNAHIEPKHTAIVVGRDIVKAPFLDSVKLFGNFITVSNEERLKIGINSRNMVIEQIQTSPRQLINKSASKNKMELMFKSNVKAIYFGIRNSTYKSVWSNYTYETPRFVNGILVQNKHPDIIDSASIKYGNQDRVIDISSEYFKFINPWFHSSRIPNKDGIYMYSFALNNSYIDGNGGANISRVENPSLEVTLNPQCKKSNDNFELIVVGVTKNIMTISEGVVHFPVV